MTAVVHPRYRGVVTLSGSDVKKSDQYHKWVGWSDEDRTYIGKCPDLITGIHGEDPTKLYGDLCEVVEDVIRPVQLADVNGSDRQRKT